MNIHDYDYVFLGGWGRGRGGPGVKSGAAIFHSEINMRRGGIGGVLHLLDDGLID